jgi:hypothetical protein
MVMADLQSADNGEAEPLDADLCDALIVNFRNRLEALQRDAADVRHEFDELHRRWLRDVEKRGRP